MWKIMRGFAYGWEKTGEFWENVAGCAERVCGYWGEDGEAEGGWEDKKCHVSAVYGEKDDVPEYAGDVSVVWAGEIE